MATRQEEKVRKLADGLALRLKKSPDLANDEEYLRSWLGLASEVDDSVWIFDQLEKLQIGEKLALRWIAEAFIAEKGARYAEADEILSRGVACDAQPRVLLAKRRREFDRRMKRHWLSVGCASSKQSTAKTKHRQPLRVLQAPITNVQALEPPLTAQNKPKINRKLVFSTAKREAPQTANIHWADNQDMTINSIIAAREIDDIFIDNLSLEDNNEDTQDQVIHQQDIFQDEEQYPPAADTNLDNSAFTIFCDG